MTRVYATLVGALVLVTFLRFNVTASMPRGAYLFIPVEPHRGDIVQACMWEIAHCAMPVEKVLAAVSGDVVSVAHNGIAVNGKMWPQSATQSFDSHGNCVATHLAYGRSVVPRERVLLLGLNPKSFDGRYVGFTPSSLVAGRLIPLMTESF